MTLFTLHGLAVSLRDRADTVTERAEALLLGVERAYGQQMMGEPVDFGELLALAEAAAAESDTSRRLAEKVLRGARALVRVRACSCTLPKLVASDRVLKALPTLSDAAATLRRAIPRARLITVARDLTEALGALALAATQRPLNEDDLLPLRSVFARLDGLPQALSGARERLGVALAEIDGR
ncbi:MAG: hypothetical protein IPO67_18125 [Deltaproteobacteria bacterium]|nr:hypothetical protein [Deltaproteobacteria bacterium]